LGGFTRTTRRSEVGEGKRRVARGAVGQDPRAQGDEIPGAQNEVYFTVATRRSNIIFTLVTRRSDSPYVPGIRLVSAGLLR
jgi:hypothetical protein